MDLDVAWTHFWIRRAAFLAGPRDFGWTGIVGWIVVDRVQTRSLSPIVSFNVALESLL